MEIRPGSVGPVSPAGTSGAAQQPDRLRESTREFESFFLEQLLKQMRSSVRALSPDKPSFGREIYEGWQDQELARSMASGIGTGLGELMYRDLQQQLLRKTEE